MNKPLAGRALAQKLLKIGAISLSPEDPFTWSSGLRAPVYCDMRLTLGYPELRSSITSAFADVVRARKSPVDVVAGTATAGIPQAALLAERLARPMVYVRSKAKGHGRRRRIEGVLRSGSRVVLVEDLVSTGGSALEAAEALGEKGAEVELVVALFSYGLPAATRRFEKAGVPVETLLELPALLEVAEATGELEAEALAQLRAWREDPRAWSERIEERLAG